MVLEEEKSKETLTIININGVVMSDETKKSNRCTESAGFMGPLWIIGWLFTIGFLKLTFGKGFLALILWPYYIGTAFAK